MNYHMVEFLVGQPNRADFPLAESVHLQAMKILVVDDEEDTRDIASMCLGLLGGVEVLQASSGFECLQLAEQELPGLILLDLMMPVMDGAETITRLRQNPFTSNIPVIFFTVKGIPSEIERMKALGALAVLQKPFDPTTLTSQIMDILKKSGINPDH